MFRLDYLSCVLTISAAILLGQKRWQGWLVAGINSVLVCEIALHTAQLGFIPANVFCVGLYAWNIWGWRRQIRARRELQLDLPAANALNHAPRPSAARTPGLPRPLPPSPLAEPRLEALCCLHPTPSRLDVPDSFARQHPDLRGLLSCPLAPR